MGTIVNRDLRMVRGTSFRATRRESPAEALRILRVKEGQRLHLTETPDGVLVTSYDPEFAKTMEIAEDFAGRYRNALRKLAE